MKKMIVALVAVVAFAGVAVAGDVIEFNAKNGKVTFNHKAHQDMFAKEGGCAKCHKDGKGGKMPNFSKDTAHKELCKECHTKMGKGPTNCGGCHKK